MKINYQDRTLTLNVRELAEFQTVGSLAKGASHPWRAEEGKRGHQAVLPIIDKLIPGKLTEEYTISTLIKQSGWIFTLRGRIDALKANDQGITLVEIKTINAALPQAEEALQQLYPHYFRQINLYQAIWARNFPKDKLATSLLWYHTQSKTHQHHYVEGPANILRECLKQMIPFLEDRRNAWLERKAWPSFQAFTELRPGQEEVLDALQQRIAYNAITVLEAPTGFGKTGTLWQTTLKSLKNQRWDRIIYATAKNSGQVGVIDHLAGLIGSNAPRFIRMRSQEAHAVELKASESKEDYLWPRLGVNPLELFEEGTVPLKRIQELGRANGIEPYVITKGLLGLSDIWVVDFNYLFSPFHQGVLESIWNYDPATTLIIVDEAHNLSDRIRGAMSFEISLAQLEQATAELYYRGTDPSIRQSIESFLSLTQSLQSCPKLEEVEEKNWKQSLTQLCESLKQGALPWDDISEDCLKTLWEVDQANYWCQEERILKLMWVNDAGSLMLTCLQAAHLTSDMLSEFGHVVMASGTLTPKSLFLEECGLHEDKVTFVEGQAPWRKEAYRCFLDKRVDTRYRYRSFYYESIAQSLKDLSELTHKPIVTFFSSFEFAQQVAHFLPKSDAFLPTRRRCAHEENNELIAALENKSFLMLVLGSRLAEGIDVLGGKSDFVVIVGPALPQVNNIQEELLNLRKQLHPDKAFEEVFIAPGIKKVNQALGRLVRKPEDRVNVLFLCQRFQQPEYKQYLTPEYRWGRGVIRDDASWTRFLARSRQDHIDLVS